MKKTFSAVCFLFLSLQLNAADKTVAVLNGETVTYEELSQRMWINYSSPALQELLDEKLILQEADKAKIKILPAETEERLKTIISSFKNKAAFLKALKTINISEENYRKTLEKQLRVNETVIKLKKVSVSDEEAKKYYQANPEQFKRPESARIRQLLVKTEQEAEDAYLAIQAGADFEKLAAIKSSDETLRKNSGEIGYVSRGTLLPEIEKEVFALKPGEMTKPLATQAGFSIIRLEDIKPAGEFKFEDIRENLKLALFNKLLSAKKAELLAELKANAKIELK